jgi:hypothetical protein
MGPMNPGIHGELSCLRMAELHEAAARSRQVTAGTNGRAGRGAARALRSLADRLDPGLEPDSARIA